MKQSIYLKGIEELERNTNRLLKEVHSGETALLLEQARLVRDRIKQKAPLGPTGNLKKATYASALPETTTGNAVAFAGIRPRKAPHGHLLEFGTVKMRPHPFVRPAWDEMKEEVRKNIKEGLKRLVEGAV